jgi:hypothetical protein
MLLVLMESMYRYDCAIAPFSVSNSYRVTRSLQEITMVAEEVMAVVTDTVVEEEEEVIAVEEEVMAVEDTVEETTMSNGVMVERISGLSG